MTRLFEVINLIDDFVSIHDIITNKQILNLKRQFYL